MTERTDTLRDPELARVVIQEAVREQRHEVPWLLVAARLGR